jgi:hypothetical protein
MLVQGEGEAMELDEAERLCDALAELASKGPSKDPKALVEATAILRKITQSPETTPHVQERASLVERALSGWLDSDERFHLVLKGHSSEIYGLIDRLHGALREASRFGSRRPR